MPGTTYPVGPLSYERTVQAVREALAEELAQSRKAVLPEYIITATENIWVGQNQLAKKHRYDLSRFYYGILWDYTPPRSLPAVEEVRDFSVDINKYWTDDGFTIPGGYYNWLEARAKVVIEYPFVVAYTKLPKLDNYPCDTGVWFCAVEAGPANRSGIAGARLGATGGGTKLEFVFGGGLRWLYIDVTNRLPSDFDTAPHTYVVKVNAWGAEFYIDGELAAVGIDLPGCGVRKTIASPPPYAVGVVPDPVMKMMQPFVEIGFPYPSLTDIRENPGPLTLPLSPFYYRWAPGVPCPPRVRPLYKENSDAKFAGLTDETANPLTSHPVPVWGYGKKLWLFQASVGGTVRIEVWTTSGNWREYDSDSYTANDVFKYHMEGPVAVARLVFEPSSTPYDVNEGEVLLVGSQA